MKNTILTLASIAALAGVVNAQTYSRLQFDIAGYDTNNGDSTGVIDTGLLTDALYQASAADKAKFTGITYTLSNADVPNGTRLRAPSGTNMIGGEWTLSFSQSVGFLFLSQSNPVDGTQYTGIGGNWENGAGGVLDSGYTVSGNVITNNSGGVLQAPRLRNTTNSMSVSALLTSNNTTNYSWGVFVDTDKVPEPSSTALLGLGTLGLLARRKR